MKNYSNYRTVVFTVTTSLIFFIWSILQSSFVQFQGIKSLYTILIGSIVSLGTYKIVLNCAEIVILKIPMIKKIVFGSSYLEGVWVGAYIGKDGNPRFIIEYYEQDFEQLIIRGKAFYEDKKYKGCWTSDNVSIDTIKGKISYTYNSAMEDNGFYISGFAEFHFERKTKNDAPYMLYGYSTDIDNPSMNNAIEVRINLEKEAKENDLIEKAVEVYEQNKERLVKK